jgi:hypothetical protein
MMLNINALYQKKISGTKKNKKQVEITPLMSFKHLKMFNSASKCLKITLRVIKFSKPETKFKKNKLMGDIPPCQIHAGDSPPPTV